MPELSDGDWITIYKRLDAKRLTPILGDRVFRRCLPGAGELVSAWKKSVNYPYANHPSVSRLARYVSAETTEPNEAFLYFVKEHLVTIAREEGVVQAKGITKRTILRSSVTEIAERLGYLQSPDERLNALRSLASLPLPIFITTSYYRLLEKALEAAGKNPESAICYWRKDLKPETTLGADDRHVLLTLLQKGFAKEEIRTLAFHLFDTAYDDLPDEGHGSLARELFARARREGVLEDLVEIAREEKPSLEWDPVLEAMGLGDAGEAGTRIPSIFKDEPDYRPSPGRPLVYHLYGIDSHPASLVLTEDDYIDFLLYVSADKRALPADVRTALAGSSLLLLGFELHDWEFITLFRGLITSRRRSRSRVNVCLQHRLAGEDLGIVSRSNVEKYLDRYLGNAEFRIFWGTPEDFLAELQDG